MITIFDWFGYKLPMKERYALIKRAGFDGVALWWGEEFGDCQYRANPALAREAGLFVENIHAPFEGVNNLWLNNLAGSALTDLFLRVVDDCAEYEIPTMILHLSSGDPPPFNESGLNNIRRIVEKAERRSVNIAFENVRRLGRLNDVLSRVDSPRAGFCYDTGHWNCFMPHEDLIAKYGSRLMALHLHDNDGDGDQHRLPFEGTIDWPATMRKIAKAGYTGAVALETVNIGYEEMEAGAFLHLAFERAKRLEGLK